MLVKRTFVGVLLLLASAALPGISEMPATAGSDSYGDHRSGRTRWF